MDELTRWFQTTFSFHKLLLNTEEIHDLHVQYGLKRSLGRANELQVTAVGLLYYYIIIIKQSILKLPLV